MKGKGRDEHGAGAGAAGERRGPWSGLQRRTKGLADAVPSRSHILPLRPAPQGTALRVVLCKAVIPVLLCVVCCARQELGRFNTLLNVIRTSLLNLGKAVRGLALMSAELDAVGRALFDGKVRPSRL